MADRKQKVGGGVRLSGCWLKLAHGRFNAPQLLNTPFKYCPQRLGGLNPPHPPFFSSVSVWEEFVMLQ